MFSKYTMSQCSAKILQLEKIEYFKITSRGGLSYNSLQNLCNIKIFDPFASLMAMQSSIIFYTRQIFL